MFRSIWLLRAPPLQHARFPGSIPGGRHVSMKGTDRSIAVANTRSPTPVLGHVRHTARPVLQPSHSIVSLAPLSITRIPLSRTYSQAVAPDIDYTLLTEDEAMARKAIEQDSKSADILNGDLHEPAGQAEPSLDPESDENVPLDAEELKEALGRPPPVNSSYLPLPWKGRLGYVSRDAQQLLLSCKDSNTNFSGLFKYLPAILQSSCLLLPYLPHCFYCRESTPAPRSRSACASYKESSRSGPTGRHSSWTGLRGIFRPGQCARPCEALALE